ncbi:MAG: dihydrofolate reductase [Proteobacteria bacterium]|nr:dihydrofolate reductase [Pseudomonadota bacterium]
MKLGLIYARARNGVIGKAGGLPWHLPQDLAHFKRLTLGCPVIMGRRTWDSLPARFRPLPGRRNVVVSRNAELQAQGAEIAADLETALARVAEAPRAFVIGGAQLYAQALPMAHTLVLTEIDADLDGDAFFPAWERSQFEQTGSAGAVTAAGVPYRFVTYRRRQAAACQHT